MKSNCTVALLCLCSQPLPLFSVPVSHDQPAGAKAAVLPVVTLEKAADVEVMVVFENTSRVPIHYLLGIGNAGVAHLEFYLTKDGRKFLPQATFLPPRLSPERIRELKPGEGVPVSFKVRNVFGDLKPGRYALVASYQRGDGVRRDGMTPVSMEQKVLYLDVK